MSAMLSAVDEPGTDRTAPTASPGPATVTRESLADLLHDLELRTVEDFRAVAGPARRAERVAAEHGWTDLRKRAELVTGDVLGRLGQVADQGRIAKSVNMWAQEHADRYLLARSHRLLAIFFRRLGDAAEALTHAVPGVEYADVMPPLIRASHLITLALVLDLNGSFEQAQERFSAALEIATKHDAAPMVITILNNMAFTAYENEDGAAADELVARIRRIAAEHTLVLDGLYLDTMARISMMGGRPAEALEILRPVLADPDGPLVTEGDALPECLLTVAEAHRLSGQPEQAREALDEAARLAGERSLASVTARVHEARAELHALTGDFAAAYAEYRLFHAATEKLHSVQREMRARAVQAVFETAEARLATEQFRQLALHDPLTGIYNRRHVDEQLERLAGSATRDGTALSVALVDLDFFKRVNDTFSHGVGDQVLRRVATLLGDAVAEPALAARLGGEEFLLVLPGADPLAATAACERLLETLRRHPWQDLTGSLPVTASIGVASFPHDFGSSGGASGSALLTLADHNLYAAKHAGRNRVVHGALAP
ncbi:GGDEF domain-containing protein [Actinoplanes sp. ATCC 53533]|uniref:tetratricopeptide repeat-containing diguanylate cyclase n=1 Tax=Actinoplanes sp. ATCC 53533 TaxID=1288362 RepID=UPI000F780E1D|nr:GGDEF domain-containing protein [Actinoplanes sp. ATCC 53533]RSM70735.1 GGDEF domain-containing protein [Actinoplanes sp. ATCC 53533]